MAIVRFAVQYISALALTIFCFTVGLLQAKNRVMVRRINEHFGLHPLEPSAILPEIALSQLVSDSSSLHLLKADAGENGNVTVFELVTISRLISEIAPEILFEIGTFDGRTTLNMAANAPANAKVYTLDLPSTESATLPIERGDTTYIDKPVSGAKFIGTEQAQLITQLFGDSARFDFGPYESCVDFIFVDGAHSYEYVKKDSETALRLLKPGTRKMILWHDYGSWRGVTKALNELYRTRTEFTGLRRIAGTTLACLVVDVAAQTIGAERATAEALRA